MDTEIKYNRAHVWQIGLFAFNNTATNTMLLIMAYVSFYANGVAGIAVMTISTLLTAMRIFDGITDPIIGYLIDKTDSKFGKFRPAMILGYLIMVVAMAILYTTLHIVPEGIRIIYFVLVYGLYIVGYTFQTACTKAAQACLTNDPKQRPLFTLFDTIWGTILVTASPIIVANLVEIHGDFSLDFFFQFVPAYVALSGVFTVLAIIGIAKKDKKEFFGIGNTTKVGFKDYVDVIKHNRAIQMLIVAAASDKLALTVAGNAVIAVIIYGIVAGDFGLSGDVAAYTAIPKIIIVFIGIQYARKLGQKKALIASTWLSIITYLVLGALILWGPMTILNVTEINTFTILYIVVFILMGSFAAIASGIVIPMIADCSDYETARTGRYIPGMMGTLFSFIDKLVSSLATTIVGFGMVAIGFADVFPTVDTVYTDALKYMGVFLFIGLPIIGFICTLIGMKFYPLTAEKMCEIQEQIAGIKENNNAE
ncbi:MFS transporter [Candidatus Epulonipiscium viviparus]|uniref:MFS transporter n=1 Tax=Candidatus Epulonipiscium viviparus TaxID=420336 RepID=UPI0027380E87|nr:MFS transporter [Candidatus Epulopiscium viviparus]